ncbi:MAG: PAS domain-containing protein [Caulobacteraceae bacterium]|nr:PAS domain-containing protein [Caulobacter sp.]
MTDPAPGERGDGRFPADALKGPGAAPPDLPHLEDAPSDADFRLLADELPSLCWIARGDGDIVWCNRRWHAYCGTTPEAMDGWDWRSVHDPDELPRVAAGWSAAIAGGRPFEMVFPLRGADGVFRPFLTRASPLMDAQGRVTRWFGVNVEISERLAAEKALGESQGMYRVLTDAMPQMVWSTLPDGFHDYYNRRWYEYTGVPQGSTDGEAWNGMFHPDDQERAWARWRRSLATGEPYEIEYRLRHRSGEYRWTLGRALPVRDAQGAVVRWIGTCTDIHEAKTAAEETDLLSHELSHRIKNIFSIIAGLIALSARREPAAKPFARDLSERIAALGRAHEFARPHSDRSRPHTGAATLHGLLAELFRPYALDDAPRVRVEGDDAAVDDRGATPLALLFHELATNAAKYGALSRPGGGVTLGVRNVDGRLVLTWRETGGPELDGDPLHEGFGSRLAALSVEQQLGGRLTRAWRREGLEVVVELAPDRLARS